MVYISEFFCGLFLGIIAETVTLFIFAFIYDKKKK